MFNMETNFNINTNWPDLDNSIWNVNKEKWVRKNFSSIGEYFQTVRVDTLDRQTPRWYSGNLHSLWISFLFVGEVKELSKSLQQVAVLTLDETAAKTDVCSSIGGTPDHQISRL